MCLVGKVLFLVGPGSGLCGSVASLFLNARLLVDLYFEAQVWWSPVGCGGDARTTELTSSTFLARGEDSSLRIHVNGPSRS